MRKNNRKNNELRNVNVQSSVNQHAEGSALIEMGDTRVLCTASVETSLPKWLQGQGRGWVTAEYGMLPRSTHTRIRRDKAATGGRTQEISRLIARSLRAVVDLSLMPDASITVDCDVLQADGGTRTASITGGYIALAQSLNWMVEKGRLGRLPLLDYVSAISVGLNNESSLLDLDYDEDSSIETDINFVMTGSGGLVEIQGTAEKRPFTQEQLTQATNIAKEGCEKLFQVQENFIGDFFPRKRG